jgi:hypothetical protein
MLEENMLTASKPLSASNKVLSEASISTDNRVLNVPDSDGQGPIGLAGELEALSYLAKVLSQGSPST